MKGRKVPKEKSHSHFMCQEKSPLHPLSSSDYGQEAGAGYTGPASSQQAPTRDGGVTVSDSLLCSRQGSALPPTLHDRNPPAKLHTASPDCTAQQQMSVAKEWICLETWSCCQAHTKTTLPKASGALALFVSCAHPGKAGSSEEPEQTKRPPAAPLDKADGR